MKKLLIVTLTGTLLLGSCGNNNENEKNKNQSTTTTNKQEKFIDYYHNYTARTIGEVYNLMNYIYEADPEDVTEEEVISKYTKSAYELEKSRTKFKKRNEQYKNSKKI